MIIHIQITITNKYSYLIKKLSYLNKKPLENRQRKKKKARSEQKLISKKKERLRDLIDVSESICFSSGMVQSVGANLSPDQTFGSIRSLSVTREVASFPLSRTPTPPPQHRWVIFPYFSLLRLAR